MKIKEAARISGMSEQTLRTGLQQKVFPFGVAFKTNANRKNYHYVIFPEKLREYMGIDKGGAL